MGVPVPEVSLSVHCFLFHPTFEPRFAFFSVLFVHIALGYLLPFPYTGLHTSSPPHENISFTLRGGWVLTCYFFWGRLLDDTNFSSSPLSFYLFSSSSSLLFLLWYCQQKLELEIRSSEKKKKKWWRNCTILCRLDSESYLEFFLMREENDADLMLQAYSPVNDSCSIMSNGILRLNATDECGLLDHCCSSMESPQVTERLALAYIFHLTGKITISQTKGKRRLFHIVVHETLWSLSWIWGLRELFGHISGICSS